MNSAITTLFVILFGVFSSKAQSNTVSSGGNAGGSGGTVSYSVGQIDYISSNGSNGSIHLGVQQPYEIYATSGLEEYAQLINLMIGPNPTADHLNISVKEDIEGLTLELSDLNGKLLLENRELGQKTELNLSAFPVGSYMLTIYHYDRTVKTCKILKK